MIKHALNQAEKYNIIFENIIDLDVTSPLRNIKDIINAFKKFKRMQAI